MAGAKELNRYSEILRNRGIHRLSGPSSLTAFSAFLILILLLRVFANLYMLIDIYRHGNPVDLRQFTGIMLAYGAALMLWCGSLASYRTGLSIPEGSFIDHHPRGQVFRRVFYLRSALLQPRNVISAGIIIIASLVPGLLKFSTHLAALIICTVVFVYIGMVLIFRLLGRLKLNPFETEIIETLFLLFLVLLNPDLGPGEGSAVLLVRGVFYPFNTIRQVLLIFSFILFTAVFVLVIMKLASRIGFRMKLKKPMPPLQAWYWRLLRARTWLLLYFLLFAIFMSPYMAVKVKTYSFILSIIFCAISFLFFLSYCDNTLREKWGRPLINKRNMPLLFRLSILPLLTALPPVILFILFY